MMFKKLLVGIALSVLALSASALQSVVIVDGSKATASTFVSVDQFLRDAAVGAKDLGVIAYVIPSAFSGAYTVQIQIQGKTAGGIYYDYGTVGTATQVAVGVPILLTQRVAAAAVAGTVNSLPVPPVFRIKVITAGAGTGSFSVGLDRIQ